MPIWKTEKNLNVQKINQPRIQYSSRFQLIVVSVRNGNYIFFSGKCSQRNKFLKTIGRSHSIDILHNVCVNVTMMSEIDGRR